MESNAEDPTDSSARNDGGGEGNEAEPEAEAVDLLEEAWFFGNLLHRNRKHMTRCLSDPCPSSSYCNSGNPSCPKKKPDKESLVPPRVPDNAHPPVDKNLDRRESSSKNLIQDSSSSSYDDQSGHFHSPSSTEKTISEMWLEAARGKASDGNGGESRRRSPTPRPALLRAPSLPPCIGREDVDTGGRLQTNSHPRMSKSNRQSSLNISGFLPHQHDPEGMPSHRFRISSGENMGRRLLNRTESLKSRDELEFEELQGFKDLGFTFDKKDLSPSIVNILPGLQEKEDRADEEEEGDQKQRKPYLSEAWLSRSFAPPIPKWNPRGSAEEDVKAHIKFWARAVASNVRQEC